MPNLQSEGTQHSNAPTARRWDLKGSADALPGKEVSQVGCEAAGGIEGSSCYTAGLGLYLY